MIYTSSKERRETYRTLVYSDKQLSLYIHVLVIACAKLKLLNYLDLVIGGIYGIEWRIVKLKLSNELEHRGIYLQNDIC